MPEELVAGPELDRRIAEAFGLEAAVFGSGLVFVSSREWDDIGGGNFRGAHAGVASMAFQPSRDLNMAFEAAEKMGLFDARELCLGSDEGAWSLFRTARFGSDCEVISRATTPALAICEAILKLRETK